MLCVELPQMQYIDWSELIHIWKLSQLLWQVNTKPMDNFFCVCPFFLNRAPFNRGKKYKDYVNIFQGRNLVSPEWKCPLNRGVPKERYHCI